MSVGLIKPFLGDMKAMSVGLDILKRNGITPQNRLPVSPWIYDDLVARIEAEADQATRARLEEILTLVVRRTDQANTMAQEIVRQRELKRKGLTDVRFE